MTCLSLSRGRFVASAEDNRAPAQGNGRAELSKGYGIWTGELAEEEWAALRAKGIGITSTIISRSCFPGSADKCHGTIDRDPDPKLPEIHGVGTGQRFNYTACRRNEGVGVSRSIVP